MPEAARNHPGGVALKQTIRFGYEMRSSTQLNQSRNQGQAEFSVRCPATIQRVQVTSQPNAAPVVWCNGLRESWDNRPSVGGGAAVMPGDWGPAGDALLSSAGYKVRPGHRLSSPIRCPNLMGTTEQFSLGPLGSYRAIPPAESHSTPEGWVRPQGVGPRVPHHAYVWTEESLTAKGADQYQIQSYAMSETE